MQYKKIPNNIYRVRKRASYKMKILETLAKQGPLRKAQIKKALNVPPKQERTCERAFKELKDGGLATEDESTGMWYARGQEPPETVEIRVGSPNLELTIPAKREQAKKIIEKTPELKRDKKASTVLKETGLLEKEQ
jgi:hypothetical protein